MPRQSALLVLDMQEYFLDPASHAFVPSGRSIIPGIQKLVTAYSQRNMPVIFTQHINTRQDAGMMSSWWNELIVEVKGTTARCTCNGEVIEEEFAVPESAGPIGLEGDRGQVEYRRIRIKQ